GRPFGPEPVRLLRRGGGDRAGLDRAVRDPERLARARADRALRRANVHPELPLLLRLVGRARPHGAPPRPAPPPPPRPLRWPSQPRPVTAVTLRPRPSHAAADLRPRGPAPSVHPVAQAPAEAPGEGAPRDLPRARRDALEPVLRRALPRRHLRRDGGWA